MSKFRRPVRFKPTDTAQESATKLNRLVTAIERSQPGAMQTITTVTSGRGSGGSGSSSVPSLIVRTADGLSTVANVTDISVKETDGFTVTPIGAGAAQVGLDQPILKTSTPEFAGEKLTAPLEHVAAAAPGTPDADHVKTYVRATGVSPNREVAYCMKDEAGREIIISSVLV